MALPKLENPMEQIRSLPDQPKLSDGYTPQVIKARFDRAGEEIRDYLNDTLLSALESTRDGESGAEEIGSAALDGIEAGSVHAQLLALEEKCSELCEELTDAAAGILPPESVPLSKLDAATQEMILSADARTLVYTVYSAPGEHVYTVPKTGTYRVRLCAGGAAGSFFHPVYEHQDDLRTGAVYPGFGGGAGAAAEVLLPLNAGDKYRFTVGAGGTAVLPGQSGVDPTEESYELADLVGYQTNGDWIAPGGDSVFCEEDGSVLLTCRGGDPSLAFSGVEASLPDGAALLSFAGAGFSPDATDASLHAASGVPSRFGTGGTAGDDPLAPGAGGGGAGGALTLSGGVFHTSAAPQNGAAGLVIIESVG